MQYDLFITHSWKQNGWSKIRVIDRTHIAWGVTELNRKIVRRSLSLTIRLAYDYWPIRVSSSIVAYVNPPNFLNVSKACREFNDFIKCDSRKWFQPKQFGELKTDVAKIDFNCIFVLSPANLSQGLRRISFHWALVCHIVFSAYICSVNDNTTRAKFFRTRMRIVNCAYIFWRTNSKRVPSAWCEQKHSMKN